MGAMKPSAPEALLAAQLRAAGIAFEQEFKFCAWRKWRADFAAGRGGSGVAGGAWLTTILVEIQGGGFIQGGHSRGMGLERDCEKLATAAALGWRVLPVTPRMVRDGRALALIEAALGLRSLEAPQVKPKPRRSRRNTGRLADKRNPGASLSLPLRARKAGDLA